MRLRSSCALVVAPRVLTTSRRATPRLYTTSSSSRPYRAVTFTQPGDPLSAVSVRTFPHALPPPGRGQVRLRMLLSPINPSDVNVIQGVYPSKPRPRTDEYLGVSEPVYLPGNEGLGEVTELGPDGSDELKVGDRVVMGVQQPGTWANYMNIDAASLIRVRPKVSAIQAATMSINPPTALAMLRSFAKLEPGDFVIQNGANSAVGQAVVQIAKALGLKTINLMRDRPDFEAASRSLGGLGADHVITYEDLDDKSVKDKIKDWTGGKPIRLALNCVSGPSTTSMLRLLGQDAHLVSYGAMSRQPLSIPTSYFIFKNLTAHGFMMSSWFAQNGAGARKEMIGEIMGFFEDGLLREPTHEIVTLDASRGDEGMTEQLRDVLRIIEGGSSGRKFVLRFEE